MEEKAVHTNDSPEFLCPSCGTSAFEVIAKQKNVNEDGGEEEFLVMKCLVCLEVFYHRLALPEPAECLLNS
jgi:uncharacterized Zn finger protein